MSFKSTCLSTVLFIALITACQPVVMKPQKMIITNEIINTSIVGDSDFTMAIDGVVLQAKPVDARDFDGDMARLTAMAFDGGFRFVDVSISFENVIPDTTKKIDFSTRGLLPRLTDAGIRHEHSMAIVRMVSEEFTYYQRRTVAKNNYFTESIILADTLNPFTIDQRYLTLFKLKMSNTSNLMKEFCLPTLRLHTTSNVFEPYVKSKFLEVIPYGSVKYEVLNQLLASECTVLPPQTTVDRYLPFPSVRNNEKFRLTAQTGNQMNSVNYTVKRDFTFEKYVFNPARIITKASSSEGISVQSSTPGVYSYSEVMYSMFIFLESKNRVFRVDNNEFLLQEGMSAGDYNIIVVRRNGDVYKVDRVPLDPSTLVDGVILVELSSKAH